jgi:hypothetical protein
VIRGPRCAEATALLLLAHKPIVIAALTADWRARTARRLRTGARCAPQTRGRARLGRDATPLASAAWQADAGMAMRRLRRAYRRARGVDAPGRQPRPSRQAQLPALIRRALAEGGGCGPPGARARSAGLRRHCPISGPLIAAAVPRLSSRTRRRRSPSRPGPTRRHGHGTLLAPGSPRPPLTAGPTHRALSPRRSGLMLRKIPR